jgi:uncharacterized protein YdaU (DUF1376 family)
MNYYKRHLGDYAKDTRHLSLMEHGAFCLLLDYYYATERPIPDDRCERIANAYADAERAAVRSVLKEFFTETPEGWRNDKADEVIDESRGKSLKAKESAKARWEETQCDRNANASKTHSERNASHKPLASNHKKEQELEVLPEWLPANRWQDFIEHRKALRKPMTDKARTRMLTHLADLKAKGHDVLTLMDTAIRSGWQDVYEPKPAGQFNSPSVPRPPKTREQL